MKWDGSLKVFSLLFGAIYMACFYFSIAPFRYYPQIGRFHIAEQAESAGPPILWYGWLTAAFAATAVVALVVPSRLANRVWHGWLWVVPALTVVGIFLYEKRWFL